MEQTRSGRRRRRLRVRATLTGALLAALLGGCASPPVPELASDSDGTAGLLLVTVGNSFIGGSAMDSGTAHRWPGLVATALGMRLDVITAGGSGYVDPGDAGLTYRDLVHRVPADADVVVIMGSDDDASSPLTDIERAARIALAEAIDRAPHARVLVTSTPWVQKVPDAGIRNTRDAVRQAADELGLEYIDGLGTWLVTGPPGQIGSDGLHPTDLGHAELAAALIGPIRSAAEQVRG
ncbi:MAG: SGNH/GDSL hydrolase family protein [Actinobacteria bacterium]|nr:SGNH/GDSL hydrolase family protein [Actinomycetota bacterium]